MDGHQQSGPLEQKCLMCSIPLDERERAVGYCENCCDEIEALLGVALSGVDGEGSDL